MLIIPQMNVILCEFVWPYMYIEQNARYTMSCALSQAIAKWVHPETGLSIQTS